MIVRSVFTAVLAALVLPACGASDKDIRTARESGYETDFSVVYARTLAAVRELYPEINENPKTGVIKTAWHPIRVNQQISDSSNTRATQSATQSGFQGNTRQRILFFVRFDVRVAGGKPWRVHVKGQAASLRVGQIPTPLRGAEIPPWLEGRTDALRVDIHNKLADFAVPAYDNTPPPDEDEGGKDETVLAAVVGKEKLPKAAVPVIAQVIAAARDNDVAALGLTMSDTFLYTLGGARDPKTVALAVWQADPTIAKKIDEVLALGCSLKSPGLLLCPAAGKQQGMAYRAEFSKRSGAWKFSAFYRSLP